MKSKTTALFLGVALTTGAILAQERKGPPADPEWCGTPPTGLTAQHAKASTTAKATPPTTQQKPGYLVFDGMTTHEGKTLDARALAGKNLIVYFGYPDCKMICPIATQNIVAAIKNIERAAPGSTTNIVPVFVTNETGYSVADIKGWRERFKGESVGAIVLTGDEKALSPFQGFRFAGPNNTHSPQAYFFKDGKFTGLIQTQEGPAKLEEAIRTKFGGGAASIPAPAPAR